MIKISAFRAPDQPDKCFKFYEGHRRLLEIHFGVAKVTSGSDEWMKHENTFVIIAEDMDEEKVYGGARVQVADGKIPLPIETAIGKYDKNIHPMVASRPSAEICGLWNSREAMGWGIGSIFMARVGITICNQLPVETAFFLCAPVTVKIGKRIGGIVEKSLGNEGLFYYPKDDFIATAMIIPDCKDLVNADAGEREKIFDLRKNPTQSKIEEGPREAIEVHYNLKLNNQYAANFK